MASTLLDAGRGQIELHSEAVRGDDAEEALADRLMGPTSVVPLAVVVGVVVRRGIDLQWMFRPPIRVAADGVGQWSISVDDDGDVTVFTASDIRSFAARLHVAYGPCQP